MVNKPVTKLSTLWGAGVQLSRGPIARASALSLGIRLCGLALVFSQAVLTARLLGPAGYGTVATIIAASQVLAVVAIFGLGPMAVREIPARLAGGEIASLGGFLRISLFAVLLLAILFAAIAAILIIPALGERGSVEESLAFGAVLIIPLALLGLLRDWAQGFNRTAAAQVPSEILRPAIMIGVMLPALVLGTAFSPRDYLVVILAASFVAVSLSLALLWRSDLRKLPLRSAAPNFRRDAFAALPFLGIGLASIMQAELNTLLLAYFASPEETGLFQPVARIAPLMTLPVQAAGMRYAPRVAELWKSGEYDRISAITRTFTWTTTSLTLLLALLLACSGPWLMLAFGPEFSASASLLWIIAAAQVFNAFCGPVGMILMMSGHSLAALLGHLLGVIVNAALGWLLIPDFGAWGGAIAMAGGIIFWNISLLILTMRLTGVNSSLLGPFFNTKPRVHGD